ncbi:MAG: DUF3313 family protein [Victivallales bacterium]|nr:DUF3313 family protein [Victivallales bacterium]
MNFIFRGKTVWLPVVGTVLLLPLFSGCNSTPARKSDPAPETVYIPASYRPLMKNIARSGVQKAWLKPAQIRNYSRIVVAVVVAPKQIATTGWERFSSRYLAADYDEDIRYLAKYAGKSFLDAFKKSRSLQLVTRSGPSTLVLEFALVQVVPNKPVLGAVGNISNLTPLGLLLLPLKLTWQGDSNDTGGAIAMEAVLRDSVTGEVVGVFADRRKGKTAIFSLNDFTAYANIRGIIDAWTANTVTMLDQIRSGKQVRIKDETGFVVFDS